MKPEDRINVDISNRHLHYGSVEGVGVGYRNKIAEALSSLLGVSFSEETETELPKVHISPTRKILVSGDRLLFRSKDTEKYDNFVLMYEDRSLIEIVDKIHEMICFHRWISPLDLLMVDEKENVFE